MGDKTFSDFIRNATDEERARVYGEVMDKACEMQKAVMGMGSESEKSVAGRVATPGYDVTDDLHTLRGIESDIDGLDDCTERVRRHIGTLARQLAEARDHAARLDHDLDVVMSERDAAQDALQKTHIALGGDGEWVAKIPEEEPPHSGDLHVDTPALAAEVFAAKEAAERRAAEVEALLREVSLTAWGQNGPLDLLNKKPLLERIDAAIAAGEKGNAD